MLQSKLIRYFNLELLLTMKTNVLNYTIAVVLLQKNGLLVFMFKKMTITEQNYKITEKEMLIIV